LSPSGLAIVANLPKTSKQPSIEESRWIHAPHVDYLDRKLVEMVRGDLARRGYIGLIIEEPPRHGKSELCSHFFPSWFLGTFPDKRVILTSYEAEFARSWGRKVRNTVTEYADLFGVEIDQSSQAAHSWDLKTRGGMITAGVGGAITGRGGDLLIIDDPVKNSQQAQSELIRQTQWEWYRTTFRTRAEPGAFILIIGTRWHEDDLIGRVLDHQDDEDIGGKFFRVRLPAFAEEPDEEFPDPDPLGRAPGEPLFPQRISLNQLEIVRKDVGEHTWASLYQQRPSPREGALFQKEWFEIVPKAPKLTKVVRRWDMAATDERKAEDPDYTVGVKMGLGEDGNFYILDVVRIREDPGKTERMLQVTANYDGRACKIRVEQEPGSMGKLYIRTLGRGIFRAYQFRGVRETGSKMIRAEVFAAACERGEVFLVKGKWNADWLKELTRFPGVAHDDQVDASSGAHDDLVRRAGKVTSW
jgi:predicted phage terminase large subunit-like protein